MSVRPGLSDDGSSADPPPPNFALGDDAGGGSGYSGGGGKGLHSSTSQLNRSRFVTWCPRNNPCVPQEVLMLS